MSLTVCQSRQIREEDLLVSWLKQDICSIDIEIDEHVTMGNVLRNLC